MAGSSDGQHQRSPVITASSGTLTAPARPLVAAAPPIAGSIDPAAPLEPRPVRQFLKSAWPFLLAGLPALVTFVGLTFRLFPGLEPVAPPEVRRVTVTDLGVGERDRDLGDGRIANIMFFAVETVGYAADDIAVDWLVLDAQSSVRLAESPLPQRWGVIDIDTESDRVIGEIVIPPPADHPGCVVVRVFLQPAAATATGSGPPTARLLLDVADTEAFDPIDPLNPACPDA